MKVIFPFSQLDGFVLSAYRSYLPFEPIEGDLSFQPIGTSAIIADRRVFHFGQ
jgi:hypothetical protein